MLLLQREYTQQMELLQKGALLQFLPVLDIPQTPLPPSVPPNMHPPPLCVCGGGPQDKTFDSPLTPAPEPAFPTHSQPPASPQSGSLQVPRTQLPYPRSSPEDISEMQEIDKGASWLSLHRALAVLQVSDQ